MVFRKPVKQEAHRNTQLIVCCSLDVPGGSRTLWEACKAGGPKTAHSYVRGSRVMPGGLATFEGGVGVEWTVGVTCVVRGSGVWCQNASGTGQTPRGWLGVRWAQVFSSLCKKCRILFSSWTKSQSKEGSVF